MNEAEKRFYDKVEWVWENEAADMGWTDDDIDKVEKRAGELLQEEHDDLGDMKYHAMVDDIATGDL